MRSRFSPIVFSLLLLCQGMVPAQAAATGVRAELSHRATEVGEPVQLQLVVSGSARSVRPPEIKVDGLEISYVGPSTSQSIQVINGNLTAETTTIFIYQVVAKRAGDFTIPPLELDVNGQSYRTEAVALKVEKSTDPAVAAGKEAKAWAEIRIDKKSAYVGEVVPVEVRLYVDSRIRINEVTNAPELNGDGFTMQKFPRYLQENERREGQEYNVIVFRAAMTPTKAGKLTIGPCDMPFIGAVQRGRPKRNRQNSIFDMFGEDFFNPMAMEQKRFDTKAEAIEIEVKPLPVEGRPGSFAGAVGQFQMEARGTPESVKIGDPVTMHINISGEGNFDRVQAPVLAQPGGWKAYDANEKFQPGNELQTTGTKTFEIPVIPEVKQPRMPEMEFSYFDPAATKYVTLRSKPGPLEVQGEPLVAATPAPVPGGGGTNPEAKPEEKKGPADIAGLRYQPGQRANFAPLHRTTAFWLANGIAAAGLLALGTRRLLYRNAAQIREAALQREREAIWPRLQRGGADFYEQAARWIQLTAALKSDVAESASVDAAVAVQVLRPDAETAREIESVFESRAARLYAGSGGSAGEVSSAERERVLTALEQLRRR